jgi:hypothetical protein
MDSVIDEIKRRARLLHRRVQQGDARGLRQLRGLRELRLCPDAELTKVTQRRHCLSVLARDLGLPSWGHLSRLCTESDFSDFGALLYPGTCAGHWNIWCSSYEEAQAIRAQHGGYLLSYKHQFLVVDGHFIADLGLDPEDLDWQRIGRDWAKPIDLEARRRLCQRVLRARLASTDGAAMPTGLDERQP